ncbi:unnamed protein product [Somion occarium]|uniref:Uncharacterized protein n=1 Tax=Somion occarium TaxID=3059160 RepID=A0ABP1DFR0_9APHY
MRITAFPLLLAAGLAMQAAASPIRVVVVTSHQEMSPVPFGHPIGDRPVLGHMMRPDMMTATNAAIQNDPSAGRRGHLCGLMKEKGLIMANKFRQIFGLPLIETVHPTKPHIEPTPNNPNNTDGAVHILPFIGTPIARPGEGQVHGRPHFHHRYHDTFLKRVHHALMTLGPWEGRAVAFVLGCGIGVLLRMIWVMSLLTIRMFRSGNRASDEDFYNQTSDDMEYIVFDGDAETILVPPPQYTDEKVALAADSEVKTTAVNANEN